jgi:integrase
VYQPHTKSDKWEPNTPAYGRFWVDVPGPGRKQKTVALGRCPTESVARRLLREYIEREGVNSRQVFTTNMAPATTFRQQAARWIGSLPARQRRPVKPATVSGYQDALNAWILPHLGDKPLAEVSNGALRDLVGKMAEAGLSPKTIMNYTAVVKMVVASSVNAEGEPVYPRVWNPDFIGLPIVQKAKQARPTVTRTELEQIVSTTKGHYPILFALLAGTGLRIGEALGLKVSDFSPDCRALYVRRSIWRGKEQEPKTPNAVRAVDLPKELARTIQAFVAGKNGGYLFSTRTGRPLSSRNVLRVLHARKKVGFHAFRRFRAAVLTKGQVPENLVGIWLGHARNLTDRYATQLQEDLAYRAEWAERAGLGFSCDTCVTAAVVGGGRRKAA